MASRNESNALDMESKRKLLQDVDSETMSKTFIASEHGVHKSTISKILKKKWHQIEMCDSSFQSTRKRWRTAKAEDVEEALCIDGLNTPVQYVLLSLARF